MRLSGSLHKRPPGAHTHVLSVGCTSLPKRPPATHTLTHSLTHLLTHSLCRFAPASEPWVSCRKVMGMDQCFLTVR